jgi:hypothetical protein
MRYRSSSTGISVRLTPELVFDFILEKAFVPIGIHIVAVGSPLQITDTSNPAIQELLDTVNQIDQDMKAAGSKKPDNYFLHLQRRIDFGKVFMNSINMQSENELIYHSWASLRSGTHGFQSGLRFIISTQPVTVSRAQYDALKELFGKMRTNLQEDEILDPIDRKAGWRKERTVLTNELQNLTKITMKPGARQ